MKTSNVYNKHLTLDKRNLIEQGLNDHKNFKEIGKMISKSNVTISNDIKKHRKLIKCNRYGISPSFNMDCPKTHRPPYVCNGCSSRMGCRKNRYMYYALDAYNEYKEKLSVSRQGINLTPEEFNIINSIVSEDIKKGHSFSMICNNHKNEISITKRSLYNYVEKDILDIQNYNLPRKIRYKKRKSNNINSKTNKESKCRINRTYSDYLKYKEEYFKENGIDFDTVQTDTVEGVKGESVLLTLLFTQSNFLLAFKMEEKTSENVSKVFDYLKDELGYVLFYEMFPVILTDNGSEFKNPDYIENNGTCVPKTKVFYCDPRASQQKGSIEVTHEYIRRFIPKGKSFNNLTQEDITLMINHINSTPREKYKGCTPYEVLELFTSNNFFEKLNLKKIFPTSVILKSSLFIHNKKDNLNK